MEQEGWGERLATAIGERVRYFRAASGLSTQSLSDRCRDEYGYRIHRSVIAKLERGHRPTVTVADLLVLARALRVPPVSLLVSVGASAPVEVLPATLVDNWHAAKWIGGRAAFGRDGEQNSAIRPLNLFRMLDEDLGKLGAEEAGVRQWRQMADNETDPELRLVQLQGAETHRRRMEQHAAHITETRRTIREHGLDPGPLPAGVVLDESDFPESSDGRA